MGISKFHSQSLNRELSVKTIFFVFTCVVFESLRRMGRCGYLTFLKQPPCRTVKSISWLACKETLQGLMRRRRMAHAVPF